MRGHRTQRVTHPLGGHGKHVWQIVRQLPMKAGWWDAPLVLRDLAVNNPQEWSYWYSSIVSKALDSFKFHNFNVHTLVFSIQSLAFRAQRQASRFQSPVSSVQSPESSVQSPASNTCVQNPGILVCLISKTVVVLLI